MFIASLAYNNHELDKYNRMPDKFRYKFHTSKPSFCTIRAYFRAANRDISSLFAPVQTILPELNIKAVVLGSRIRMITAAKRFGLYSAFLACNAIRLRSNLQPKSTVDTMFCNCGTI
ncbi:hypothetical protein DERP_004541 [Dermatophagoides pteronyssinus]|uniref:Uncharacterized protein n=1 Tax=Dermatophagoides pteronyssinus TaxID=6956 RepID=A0ABQ8JP25_DERPT|nr:hypothetical protein DERP_004541 [Dermatophagoides pteronyssinus]